MRATEIQRQARARRASIYLSILVLAVVAQWAHASEWPQYRGANHDGVSADRIVAKWLGEGPTELWRVPLKDGFSSFTVAGGKTYTLVERTLEEVSYEVCVALDADTGRELWATPVDLAGYTSGAGDGDGPRSTPSVDGAYVYVLSSYLCLVCLEGNTGKLKWKNDLVAEYGGVVIAWENAAAPLIDGELIFVNGNASGQRLMAFRKTDGTLAWKGLNDKMTQASPVAATIHGVRQIIFHTQSGLVSVVPDTGAVLWRYAFPYNGISAAASPVVADDIVYCSAAYGTGAGAVRITKSGESFSATQLWRKEGNHFGNHWSTPVCRQGYLYGLYGHYSTGTLKCFDVATGQETWAVKGFRSGGVLLVDDHVLLLSERGDLVLVKPDPAAYTEVARYRALGISGGKCWNSPAISNGRIYARSTTEGVCLDLAAAPSVPLRMQAQNAVAGGAFRLLIGTTDGTEVDPRRVASIEVLSAPDLGLPMSHWTKLSLPSVLTNGLLQLEDPEINQVPQKFFIVMEKP